MLTCQTAADRQSRAYKLSESDEGREKGLLPCVGVALPLQRTKTGQFSVKKMANTEGQLFSFLPLNIPTNTIWHINAAFALSTNRKQLHSDDGLSSNRVSADWNSALIEEEIPKAMVSCLEELKSLTTKERLQDYEFDLLWPDVTSASDCLDNLAESFYRELINTEKELFYSEHGKTWVTWKHSYIFPTVPRALKKTYFRILNEFLKSRFSSKAEIVELTPNSQKG